VGRGRGERGRVQRGKAGGSKIASARVPVRRCPRYRPPLLISPCRGVSTEQFNSHVFPETSHRPADRYTDRARVRATREEKKRKKEKEEGKKRIRAFA